MNEAPFFHSWFGKLSPYVRLLEEEAYRLREENKSLLDRLLRLTTGWALHEEMPNAVEMETQAPRPRTSVDLMRELEELSKRESEKLSQSPPGTPGMKN